MEVGVFFKSLEGAITMKEGLTVIASLGLCFTGHGTSLLLLKSWSV